MTSFTLPQPKKKQRVFGPHFPPLPVPVESGGCVEPWRVYSGVLRGNVVLVRHSGDKHHLYNMGFFGTCTLPIPSTRSECQQRPMRLKEKNKYLRHLAGNRIGHSLSQHVLPEPFIHTLMKGEEAPEGVDDTEDNVDEQPVVSSDRRHGAAPQGDGTQLLEPSTDVTEQNDDVHSVSVEAEVNPDVWAQSSQEESEQFWGESTKEESEQFWGESTKEESENVWGESSKEASEKCCSKTSKEASDKLWKESPKGESGQFLEETSTMGANNHTETDAEEFNKVSSTNIESQHVGDCVESVREISDVDATVPHDVDDSLEQCETVCEVSGQSAELTTDHKVCHEPEQVAIGRSRGSEWSSDTAHCHLLQLSLEEAFFLSFGLGCLVVFDENQRALDIPAMWQLFQELSRQFVPRYIAYHHLRSKGWVPRQGFKFGADYLLYKEGPPFYHSTYSVIVCPVSMANQQPIRSLDNRHFSWTSLAALNRVTEQVNKEVMLLYVLLPDSFSDPCTLLSQSSVKEVILRRWISKHERQNIQHFQIP